MAPTTIAAGITMVPKKHPNYSNESLTMIKIPTKKVHIKATKNIIRIPSIKKGKPKTKMSFSATGWYILR